MGIAFSTTDERTNGRTASLFTFVLKMFFLLLVCASCLSAKHVTDHVEVDIHRDSEDLLSEIAKLKSLTDLARFGLREKEANDHHINHAPQLPHSLVDESKAISHGIERFVDFAKTSFQQKMANSYHENHLTHLAHSPIEELKAISHGIGRVIDLIKAGIERMEAKNHPILSEIARALGHYLLEIADVDGDGMVTVAEVTHAATSFDNDASVVGKAAYVILKELRPILDAYGIIHSRFADSPHDDGKGTMHGIKRFTELAKTDVTNHVTRFAHSPVDEWKSVSHVIGRVADLVNAGIKRMIHNNRNQEHHLKLSEVLQPIGHYLLQMVDANGDGVVTRAEVSHAAASFDHEAAEVGKTASAILRGLY